MNRTDWTAAHAAALNLFLDTWSGELADAIALKLACDEVDALADLMRICGRDGLAAEWVNAHSHGDHEGDKHHRHPGVAMRLELDEIAGSVEGVELREEDPDTFGAGHLVLRRGSTETLAFTEYNDQPNDDTHISGWDWHQTHHSPSGGPLHIDATGRFTVDEIDRLSELAWSWATH